MSLAALAGILALPAAPAKLSGTHRTDLQQHDLSIPGREVVQARVGIDPGNAPKHRHPGEEIVYVLEGQMQYQLEGKPPVTLKAGDVLFIPTGVSPAVSGHVLAATSPCYALSWSRKLSELMVRFNQASQ